MSISNPKINKPYYSIEIWGRYNWTYDSVLCISIPTLLLCNSNHPNTTKYEKSLKQCKLTIRKMLIKQACYCFMYYFMYYCVQLQLCKQLLNKLSSYLSTIGRHSVCLLVWYVDVSLDILNRIGLYKNNNLYCTILTQTCFTKVYQIYRLRLYGSSYLTLLA